MLLQQLDHYSCHGATDRALDLTLIRAEALTPREVHEVLSTFFEVDWHHQLYIHPRYRELFERRTTGASFSPAEICDLQMWFNLAWFGHEFRQALVRLETSDLVDVARFVFGNGVSPMTTCWPWWLTNTRCSVPSCRSIAPCKTPGKSR